MFFVGQVFKADSLTRARKISDKSLIKKSILIAIDFLLCRPRSKFNEIEIVLVWVNLQNEPIYGMALVQIGASLLPTSAIWYQLKKVY